VIKKVNIKTNAGSNRNERFFEIENIEIGVEARQLEKDKNGVLKDKVV